MTTQKQTLPRLAPGSYYGQKRTGFSSGGVVLAETVFPSRFVIPTHTHENAFFCLVVRGASTSTSELRTRTCNASVLTFHPAGEAHADHWHDGGGQCFTLELDASWAAKADHRVRLDQPVDFEGGVPVHLAVRLSEELRQVDAVSPLAIEGLVLQLLAASTRRGAAQSEGRLPPWLRRADELLCAHFADALSLQAIAAAVGVHPSHLARSFRRYRGCSIGDRIRSLRVDFARQQIMSSDMPLAQIAAAAGFADQSHFTKAFKRLAGTTPSHYRALFGGCSGQTKR